MANPNVQIDVTLNDKATDGIKNISREMKQFARDLQQVSREAALIGGVITGGFGGAFAKAQKDIPQITNEFKSLNNSIQSISDSLATAALPTLQEFTNLMNNVAIKVKSFSEQNQELINSVLKYGAVSLAVGTLGIAFSKLLSTVGTLLKPLQSLAIAFGVTNTGIMVVLASVVALVNAFIILKNVSAQINLKNFALGGAMGFSAGGNSQLFKQGTISLKSLMQDFDDLFNQKNGPVQRASDNWGRFARGFQNSLKSLADNFEEFGDSVSQSMQRAFSDTLFDAITGRINGLRAVVKALGEEILRSFLKFGTNALFESLFKKGGALSGIAGFFGVKSTSKNDHNLDKNVRTVSRLFDDLSGNMRKFARAKDDAIDALKRGTNSPVGKSAINGSSGPMGAVASISSEAINSIVSLNEQMAQTVSLIGIIGAGFNFASQQVMGLAKTYVVSQAIMVAASAVSSALMVAIGTATASALAAVWAVPAVLAAIATLGGAAAIGVAAVTAAVGSAPGIGAIAGGGGSTAGGVGAGNITLGNGAFESAFGGEIPKMAKGGIVRRPTIAMIGEAGPEAVVPLSGGRGVGGKVDIYINEAVLNSPSNIKSFVKMLKEEMAR